MKAVVAAFNQEKALVGAFSVIVQLYRSPINRFAALVLPSNDGGPLFRTFPLSHLYSAAASDKNLIFVRK